jgi:hypothetical protein
MARTARKYGINGGYGDRALFDRLARNAQNSAMISLSRLLDDGNNAISVKKLKGDQRFKQPKCAREMRKGFNTDTHSRLSQWRTNLLAHSLFNQIQKSIPNESPLLPIELGLELNVCLQIIHAYASENRIPVRSLPEGFDHDANILWREVELMVCGIFSIDPD